MGATLRERRWCRSGYSVFFNDTATTEIYTRSLHDALPILDTSGSATLSDHTELSAAKLRADTADFQSLVGQQVLGRFHITNRLDRKSTRLNSSHANTSYAVFCLKKNITTARPELADNAVAL